LRDSTLQDAVAADGSKACLLAVRGIAKKDEISPIKKRKKAEISCLSCTTAE